MKTSLVSFGFRLDSHDRKQRMLVLSTSKNIIENLKSFKVGLISKNLSSRLLRGIFQH